MCQSHLASNSNNCSIANNSPVCMAILHAFSKYLFHSQTSALAYSCDLESTYFRSKAYLNRNPSPRNIHPPPPLSPPHPANLVLIDHICSCRQDLLDFGKIPFLIAQRTGTAGLKPALYTIQVEDVATIAPSDAQAWVIGVACWVGLVFNAGFIQIVSANRASVCADGP